MRLLLLVFILASTHCSNRSVETNPPSETPTPVGLTTETVELVGFPDRPMYVRAPKAAEPAPVLFFFHGGGGNGENGVNQLCPTADRNNPECMQAMLEKRGWIFVSGNGTPSRLVKKLRTWNAGGGDGDWRCTSGRACRENVNDVAYFDAMLKEVKSRYNIDPNRVFLTGISNGAAISYRLACERSEVVSGIAPVVGGNQFETSAACAPKRPVPTLHIHGELDPCWQFKGGEPNCGGIARTQPGKKHASIPETLSNTAKRNGCDGSTTTKMANPADDGTESERTVWENCSVPTEFIDIKGGGHTWPNGRQYLPEGAIGRVTRDFGNEVILDFFERLKPVSEP